MNSQHWISQNPFSFDVIIWISGWVLLSSIISFVGGWFALSQVYRTRVPFTGAKWRMQSGQLRYLMGYNNILTIGVSPQGLYLANMFLFRLMHPPLLVPWSEIKIRRKKGWVFESVIFTLGHELAIPLRIRGSLAEKLRVSAGDRWPVEET
jgi:hypothetical protein